MSQQLAWTLLGVFIGVCIMWLMQMARDPDTRRDAGIDLDQEKKPINGEEY